jgi:hypothetical protein
MYKKQARRQMARDATEHSHPRVFPSRSPAPPLRLSFSLLVMPRKVKALPGPSRLSGILSSLRQEPRPALSAVKRLTLSYAAKNDHFGAR